MTFPPVPVYPDAIDSDYTLFLVHNTAETKLCADNAAWSQELSIIPVGEDEDEIWAENGFANINGELFYYDDVGYDGYGKVNKLKRCARNLGGDSTKFNKKGTWVRGFVVAEHHNQLVDAIMKVENFVGINFDERKPTLDWRIRNLQQLDVIFDDFACPDINFTFTVIENDPTSGILAEYNVEITPPGSISSFRLDFGDGEYTTTELTGEHRYPLNARVDPVISVSNDKCQMIQTPIERENPSEPPAEIEEAFDVPIPEVPDFPDFTFVPCEVPEPDIQLPPLVVPCISIEGQIGPIPSVIIGPDITMVSNVVITVDNPVQILHSFVVISIIGNIPSIIIGVPSVITIDPPIPPTIIIDPPIPPTIVIIPPNSTVLEVDWGDVPTLEVDWGTPPTIEVALNMARAVAAPERFSADPALVKEFGEEFADLFEMSHKMEVQYEPVGIPTEIRVVTDKDIQIDSGELFKKKLEVDCEALRDIKLKIEAPDQPIPIVFDGTGLPDEIDLIYKGSGIKVDASDIPKSIPMVMDKPLPERIIVEIPKPIPDRIIVDCNIPERFILEGPSSIPISIPEDLAIPIRFPEKMPEIPLVYQGGPIELKITMDGILNKTEDGKNCVMIVPCNK